jgi:hypothetical protein
VEAEHAMNRFFAAAALIAAIALGSFAQTGRSPRPAGAGDVAEEVRAAAGSTESVRPNAKIRPNAATATPRSYSYADWDVWRNVTIAPGESVNLDSDINFSSADAARVSMRSHNDDLPDIRMNAYWAVPQAEFFNVAEVVTGATFPYSNTGGASFRAYGNRFRLRLTNTGSSTIYLIQVVVFAPAL